MTELTLAPEVFASLSKF